MPHEKRRRRTVDPAPISPELPEGQTPERIEGPQEPPEPIPGEELGQATVRDRRIPPGISSSFAEQAPELPEGSTFTPRGGARQGAPQPEPIEGTFTPRGEGEPISGEFTPSDPRGIRPERGVPATQAPGPLDMLGELHRRFSEVRVPSPIGRAEAAEPTLLDSTTALGQEDREAIAAQRAAELRAQLEAFEEDLRGTEVDDWQLFSFSDVGTAALGGLRDGAQEVVDSLRLLSDFLGVPDNIEVLGRELPRITGDLPEVEEPETLAGEVVRPLTSFLAGFIPMVRAARAVGIGNRIARDLVAAGAAGALTFPTDEPNFADTLAQVPGLEAVIPEFIRSDPNDGEAEAKAKNAIGEVLGVGVGEAVLRPLMAGLRYFRGRRAVREAANLPSEMGTPARNVQQHDVENLRRLFARTGSEAAEDTARFARETHRAAMRVVEGDLSDDALFAVLDNLEQFAAARANSDDVLDKILRGARRADAEEIKAIAGRIARLTPEQLEHADPRLTANLIAEGRRGQISREVASFWTNSILLRVPGRLVDFTTNLANTILLPTENVLATTLTRGPRAGFREAQATAWGMMQGVSDGLRLAGRAFVEGRSIVDPQFLRTEATLSQAPNLREVIERHGSLGLLGDFIRRGAFRTIAAGDDLFKTILARSEIHRLAAREGMEQGLRGRELAEFITERVASPSDDMLRQGLDLARYGTFTRPLGELGENALAFRDSFPLGRFLVPFGRTPTNIIKFGPLERTPLAPFSNRVRADLMGRNGRHQQALAGLRMVYGSGILMMGAKWAAEGRISGGGPADREMRSLALGDAPPYSIRIGDKWVQYNRFSPLGSLLAYGADLAHVAGFMPESEFDQLHSAALVAAYRNLLDVPLFDAFATATHVIEDMARGDPEGALRELSNIGLSFVPGAALDVAQALDPAMRDARTLLDRAYARTPGLSEALPVRHDPLGDPFAPPVGFSDSFAERFLLPARVYKDDERLRPVREFLRERGLELGMPQRTIRGVPIDSETYQRYVRRRGEIALPELRNMIQNQDFAEAPRAVQQDRITTLYAEAGEAAADEIISTDPVLGLRIEQLRRGQITRDEASMQRGLLSPALP